MSIAHEISSVVFKNSSAILLARVVNAQGLPLTISQVASAKYTVFQLDEADIASETPVTGHVDRALAPSAILFDAPQVDSLWTADSTGYNFKHALDVTAQPAFPIAGLHYRCRYELTPISGQIIVVRFKMLAI